MGFIAKIFGGGDDAPAPQVAPPPAIDPAVTAQEEYQKRYETLKGQRTKDISSMRARMGASGIAADSAGWEQGLATISSSYDEKLTQLGADPYFNKVKKLSTWD
jgi:hypothetical protein